ncbi:hypothetical protein AHF37_05103 [Paragonimus kellicotti]|nr:hypothetical protein AHF37_05103 [Paragonimus kellicotti]
MVRQAFQAGTGQKRPTSAPNIFKELDVKTTARTPDNTVKCAPWYSSAGSQSESEKESDTEEVQDEVATCTSKPGSSETCSKHPIGMSENSYECHATRKGNVLTLLQYDRQSNNCCPFFLRW